MLESFNELEAIEVGLNLEKEGYEFYLAAAEGAANPKVAAHYRQMAHEEKKHFERFSSYREQLHNDDLQDSEEELTYLKRLVRMGIFAENGELADQVKDIHDEEQVLRLAIRAEKDALLFFHEAARQCVNETGKRIFDWLLTEERKHLDLLGEMFEQLHRKG